MAGETTFSDINGMAKRVYDKSGLQDLRSDCSIVTKRVGWDKGSRAIGESYQSPMTLRFPNGFTYLGSAGTANTALKQPRPQVVKQASVVPSAFILEERLVTQALARAAAAGDGAFAALASETYKGMKLSASNRVEASIIIGQKTLGTIETVTDLGAGLADLTITQATWRPGLFWALSEGATFDAWTVGTKNNASGPLVLAGIKAAERKITVSYTGTLASEITAGDNLYFEGATTDPTSAVAWNEMAGLIAQSSNITGTSLGIDASVYGNWKGNTYDVGGNFNSDVIEDAVGLLRDRGASGKLELYLANKSFGQAMAEAKVNRNFDASYSPERAKLGHKAIGYASAEIGEIELVNHPFMAQGEFLLINPANVGRVGSMDLEFGIPGVDGEQHWYPIMGTNLAGIQLQTDQCVINKRPNHSMYGFGITYS